MSPMVSVVIPVYNSAPYLKESIESVLAQNFQDYELIAVDDGSTDGSGEILDAYALQDSRIKVFHQENQGISGARNAGMAQARGKYIAVMDSDDVCLPDRLSKQVALMQKHPEVGICGTRCSFFGDKGEYLGTTPPIDYKLINCWLIFTPTLSHTSIIVRRDIVSEKKIQYDPSLKAAEDYDFYIQCMPYCRITNLKDVLMKIRTHCDSTTRQIADQGDRTLMPVHRRVISKLGFEPSNDELELHLVISNGRLPKSVECVQRVEKWLCKLYSENEKSGIYDQKTLARVLFDRWCLTCVLCKCGWPRKLKLINSSKLYLGFFELVRCGFSLGARKIRYEIRRRLAGQSQ